jgi:uncharacterized protein
MDKDFIIELRTIHQTYFANKKSSFDRKLMTEIDWQQRLIGIKGARGVGKSTALLNYINQTFGRSEKALYITMDYIGLEDANLIEIAELHRQHGGTHLFIDEIHKSNNWSLALKNINDMMQNLHVVFTSSSILEIYNAEADLSRRAVVYDMHGLSFREYLQIETKQSIDIITLDALLQNHTAIADTILKKDILPLKHFKNYLQYGYYPYYLEGVKSFFIKLKNVINISIDVDLVQIKTVDISNIRKLRKLLVVLAGEVPFEPNITKLAEHLGITKQTTLLYLSYLQSAELIIQLHENVKAYKLLSKPDKIYLQNTNLVYSLGLKSMQNEGNIRETFFANQLKATQTVNSSKFGDFLVNEKYIFEIGGRGKSFKQIADMDNAYLAVDDTEIGTGNRIPLWMFGLLY